MDETSITTTVARAIVAALDWSSTPDARRAAVSYLESLKAGDIRILTNTSFILVKKDWSSEIRLHGFKMLQHLVRLRWEEFSSFEKRNFARNTIDLISEIASPCEEWALKSQTAALVAEVVRREGLSLSQDASEVVERERPSLWQELLPSLDSVCSKGPVEAELIAMFLRWLPEDITVHNDDLEGDRRRVLLRGLTESLPEILRLLYTLLEKHFGAAVCEAGRQQLEIAKQHATTVTAVLNAVNAYAEWAPVTDLAKYGLIHGCGFLLSSVEFRLHACEFFKVVSSRKRPVDDSACEFDSVMSNIFQILMNLSRDFLDRSSSVAGGIDESEYEFADCICESMVHLGSSNLRCIAGDKAILHLYLEEMLGYFQHFKLALHFQSLPFWLVCVRESVSKLKASVQTAGENSLGNNLAFGSEQAEKDKKGVLVFISDDIFNAILDASFQRMLRKNVLPGTAISEGALELWNDESDDKDFSQYRSRILELIRLIASHKPVVAAARVSQRVDTVLKGCMHVPSQDLHLLESTQLALETVVNGIFDRSTESSAGASPEILFSLHSILEGLLQRLLSLKWTEPALVEILGRYLDALGPFLKYYPDAVGGVINKLFELLTSLPIAIRDPSAACARHARLQICTSFIRIARDADRSLLPHMKAFADTMAYLQGEGSLLRGEHNLLGEAFLIMASAAGGQQQQEVLVWLLEPLSKQWTQIEWQNVYLSDPMGLVRLCSEAPTMWSIFHTVTFFERALKRSGMKKNNMSTHSGCLASNNSTENPMAPHLSWMLPPLIRLLRCVHSLWSQPIVQSLPGELRGAMAMSQVEQAGLLGEVNSKMSKGAPVPGDGSHSATTKEGYTESNGNDIRNWLKGIRESGYNVLGLSTTIGVEFFRCLDSTSVALALTENIQSMEFRHIRQLVHSALIPLVKSCPADLWESWLEKILHPLFVHCQQALSCSWSSLLHEGRAKVPYIYGNISGSELKVEVMEEKLLRDLSREICSLLSVFASPGLNSGLPSSEQLGHANRMEMSFANDLDIFALNSLVGFLLKHKGPAVPALQISIEAFTWPDGEAVSKVTSFCEAVVIVAVSTNDGELKEFVAKNLFSAVIQGLTLESNAVISGDLVGLCRDIFLYLCDTNPVPRQVLLSLPCITTDDLLSFEDALLKTSSPKEQKMHMKSLLLLAAKSNLKALAAQKSTNIITNIATKPRSSLQNLNPSLDDDVVGLAAIT